MKTIKRLGVAWLLAIASIGGVSAQEAISYEVGESFNLLPPKSTSAVTQKVPKTESATPLTIAPLPLQNGETATKATVLDKAREAVEQQNTRQSRKASASTFEGQWIMTYKGAASGSPDGGNAITIRKSENNDSVYLQGFWASAVTLYGFYHEDTGNITIPYQKITTSTYYGVLNIGLVNTSTGARVTTQDVTLVDNGDGTLSIPGIWGMFITTGDDSGSLLEAFYNTTYQKGNSTMSHTTSGVTDTYPIIAIQSSPNTVTITNFRNLGHDVDIYLNRDQTAVVKNQVGYQTTATANYYTVGNIVVDESGTPTSWEDDIPVTVSSDKRKFSMTNWSMIYGSKYWVGLVTESTINLPFETVFPEPFASTEFEGNGTAESPYLIKSYDDIELLDNKVEAAEYNATDSDAAQYARAYQGSYFKLTADIDLQNRRFNPIGDATHHFAGTFDGDGHTIKNLYITTDDRYGAFFAQLDTVSTIKNLNFDTAYVYSSTLLPAVLTTETYGTIDNVHVNNAYVQSPSQGATALAGIANIVNNCSVTNSTIISGQGFCGSLVGQLYGKLTNSYASNIEMLVAVSLTSIPPVGGLVGASNTSPIDNCYFNGEIYGLNSSYPARIGGITGAATSATISNCFVNATLLPLNHSSAYTGGIVSYFYGKMTNCYFTGSISASASKLTGGLAGITLYATNSAGGTYSSVYNNCYVAGEIKALSTDYNAEVEVRELGGAFSTEVVPTFNNCYFDKQITNYGSKHGATTSELTSANGPVGFDSSVWTFTEGCYPRLTATANTGVAQLGATALVMPEVSTYARCTQQPTYVTLGNVRVGFLVNGEFTTTGKYATAENGTIVFNNNNAFGTDSIAVMGDAMGFTHNLVILPIKFDGLGSEESPYLIKNKADLISLSKMTSESGLSFADMYFKMTNDIDLENDREFKGLSLNPSKASVLFYSVFDGGGYTIHNMTIDNIVWTVKPEDDPDGLGTVDVTNNTSAYNGFIGRLGSTGVLRNLTIASDCTIKAFASSGSLVGISNGLVENCYNYADVYGHSSWIGGLIGQTNQGAVVRNCYNGGKVKSGYRNAGGIVGSHHGIMENCVNVGDVEVTPGYKKLGANGLKYAGGITGGVINGVITNCLNTGSVYAAEGNAGGISGSTPKNLSSTTAGNGTNDIMSCISYGIVTSGDALTTGAISGEGGSVGLISGNVWDGQLQPIGAFAGGEQEGCTSLTTKAMTSAAGIAGFDTEYWQFADGSYPILKTFADQEQLKRAAAIVVNFADDNTALDLSKNATLSDVVAWSLKNGKVYSISGSTLVVPEEITTIVLDTLVAVNGTYKKEIPLRSIPLLALDGKGTSSNPYLLKTAADWNLLADYMNKTNINFEGQFFKMTADLDFSDTTLNPLGVSPTFFDATLDGNNFAIKGYKLTGSTAYLAPISILDGKGVVKNLTVKGSVESSYSTNTKAYVAGLVGKLYGSLENCQNDGSVEATAKGYVGGLVAAAFSGAKLTNCRNAGSVKGFTYIAGLIADCAAGVTLDNCGNEGTIENAGASSSYSSYVGGLVALSYESTYTNCYNKGQFVNTAALSSYVGGIVAYANGAKDDNYYTFKNCYNTADIDARASLGGIVAYTSKSAGAAIMMVDSCWNTGNIHSSYTSNYSGGILGLYTPGSTISNCWNSGNISADKAYFTGGIASSTSVAPTSALPVNFINCENRGTISAPAGGGGGIIGNLNAYCSVQESVNKGTITGTYGLGGIVGALYGAYSEVVDCINMGSIESTSNRCGGIVGYNGNSGGNNSVISGCVNLGNVSTSCTTTGTATTTSAPSGFAIGGIVGLSPSTIENCVNLGTVTGADHVAGILGKPVKAKTVITGCYNAGKIVCNADNGGNIIGSSLSDETLWTTGNSCTDSYYITDNGILNRDTSVGTAITRADLAKLKLGEGWVNGDDYTYPVREVFAENDAVLLYSAQIIPAAEQTLSKISKDFYVGNPSGIVWTANPSDIIEFSGNDAHLLTTYYGDVVLTATKGDYSRQETITLSYSSGVNGLDNGKVVVEEQYYDLNGTRIAKPSVADGRLYIVRITYNDGTTATVKLLNK